jgi:hypothetical protein
MRLNLKALWFLGYALAILCSWMVVAPAYAATEYTAGPWKLVRSGVTQPTDYLTHAACDAVLRSQTVAIGSTVTFRCQQTTIARGVRDPQVCPVRPAPVSRPGACPVGTTGSWTQTSAFISAPYPTCWTQGPFVPQEPPIGACVAPPTVNRPPVITGTAPATATVGQLYVFAPTITDLDGDQITVRIGSRPAWISMSTATGRISGTPTEPGTVSPITIAVSDGRGGVASYSTPTITIASAGPTQPPPPSEPPSTQPPPTEPPTGTGTALLNWTPSTHNTDGTPATLTGFRIRYGRAADNLAQTAEVGPVATYTVTGLASGAWFFGVSAVSASGEGAQSNIATKVVP